jgi:uncharacterized protein YbaA (DUF1428 family)
MSYILGFVVPVPSGKKDEYVAFARQAVPIFREYGVQRGVEAWGDDVQPGTTTDFQRSVDGRDGETIVFAWHEYPDAETATAANEKMATDPRMGVMGEMPFDAQRMIFGGFETILDTGATGSMGYVDGTVIAVPTANRQRFVEQATAQAAVLIEHGAQRVVESWGHYLPKGEVTDFQRAVKATDDETPVFSWVEWASKEARNQAWPKLMADPRMGAEGVYDEQRRIFGGFRPILDF